MNTIFSKVIDNQFSSSQLGICVEILQVYNCRSSEILSAEWSNFKPGQFLILDGKKGSSSIIIRDREILSKIASLPVLNEKFIFNAVDYYKLYHHVKNHYSHLFIKFRKKKNYKVTHGFRYRAVEEVANEINIRDILHHRSAKSGKYYKISKGESNA